MFEVKTMNGSEAERLIAEAKDPERARKIKEGLNEVGTWAKKTAEELAGYVETGVKKAEVVLKVTREVASYFKRRKLIANQVIEKELEDGGLIVSCKVAHPNQILPIVRYWLPQVRIISPEGLQADLEAQLQAYLQAPA